MLEFLAIPIAIGLGAVLSKGDSDKTKIKKIFESIEYGKKDKEGKLHTPRFVKKLPIMDGEVEVGTKYCYQSKLGLQTSLLKEEEQSKGYFKDGLGRPVLIEFKAEKEGERKLLQISVFHKELTSKFPYVDVPKPILDENQNVKWVIPLGKTLSSMLWHDFDYTPHITVAGMTRFGKTVFLKVLMTYLIETHGEDVEFYIIDLKGGLEFKKYQSIRQVKMVAGNVDEAYDLLYNMTNRDEGGILQSDLRDFLKKGITDITETNIQRRRFVIVDEAGQIAPDKWMSKPQKLQMSFCQWALSELACVGGSLGYRLVYCTQYPTADVLPRSIKQNADGKISFRLPTSVASGVAIDDTGAERLPSDIKGRALYKTHELKEMQVPLIKNDEMWSILERYQEPTVLEGVAENVIESNPTQTTRRTDTVILE